MKSKTLNYNVVFTPEPEGGFTVTVPALPGCVTYGKTLKEAKTMAQDAIEAMIFSLKKVGQPIPPSDNNSFILPINLTIKTKKTNQPVYA
jgi:predicted RNase H-like HicB family nuclease